MEPLPPVYQPATMLCRGQGRRANTPPPPATMNTAWINRLYLEGQEMPGTRTPQDRAHLRSDADFPRFMEDAWTSIYRNDQVNIQEDAFALSPVPSERGHKQGHRSSAADEFHEDALRRLNDLPVGLAAGIASLHRGAPAAPPGLQHGTGICEPCQPTSEGNADANVNNLLAQLSVGSIGHPHNCAPACRYVKRYSGCREGVLCQCCHLCFWQRRGLKGPEQVVVEINGRAQAPPGLAAQPAQKAPPSPMPAPANVIQVIDAPVPPPPAPVADATVDPARRSAGTHGHPFTCNDACKYVRRKSGCRDGANCTQCHLCQWSRCAKGEKGVHVLEPATAQAVDAGVGGDASENLRNLICLQLYCQTKEPGAKLESPEPAALDTFMMESWGYRQPPDMPPTPVALLG